jgi:hypothetical protein
MKVYPPSYMTPKESQERLEADEQLERDLTDETLTEYAEGVITHYRAIMERHFSSLTPYLALYAQYPYKITVVRIEPHGTFIGYKPATEPSVEVIRIHDFNPPLESMNLFDVRDRLDANFMTFDLSDRTYDASEAEIEGTRLALSDALHILWVGIDAPRFTSLCLELLDAEGVSDEIEKEEEPEETDAGIKFDTVREMLLQDPAGFRRVERWGFQFRHYRDDRVSASDLRELETYLEDHPDAVDAICLMTSGDLTTIGRSIAVKNPRLRIWDREVLNRLVNKHLKILEKYFAPYPAAVQALSRELSSGDSSRLEEFKQRLGACPTGREHFAEYETICTELWQHVFEGKLGEPRVQRPTADRVQRRDSLFRNLRSTPFFERIFRRFDADFLIIDSKNYGDPVNSDVIEDVATYANRALGNFVIAVTRQGGGSAALAAQIRILRDRGTAVLTVSDEQMLEMVARKERGEEPEDVLEDLLDELLTKF